MARTTDVSNRIRLDQLLVQRYGYESRARARDAILRGAVSREGRAIWRPGEMVSVDTALAIDDPARRYVSRAALKLRHALDHVKDDARFDPSGRIALDIGASTGGFTQVLLEAGAAHVAAIDVGSGQMHDSLRGDERVTAIENLNARDLTAADLDGQAPGFLVCDASFISLRLVLPPALALAEPGAAGIFLVKPQFEVGRARVGKGGIVRDAGAGEAAAQSIAVWLGTQESWRSIALLPSPVEGGDGNREFLLFALKDGS